MIENWKCLLIIKRIGDSTSLRGREHLRYISGTFKPDEREFRSLLGVSENISLFVTFLDIYIIRLKWRRKQVVTWYLRDATGSPKQKGSANNAMEKSCVLDDQTRSKSTSHPRVSPFANETRAFRCADRSYMASAKHSLQRERAMRRERYGDDSWDTIQFAAIDTKLG